MSKKGLYIYGIINSNAKKQFDCSGLTHGETVYTIPYQDIAAVVSDSKIIDGARNKDSIIKQLVAHQMVIETVMADHTVIPMKLNLFALDEKEVREILNRGYKLIGDIFEKTKNKIEMDLAVTWSDFDLFLKNLGEEKELKDSKDKFLAAPKTNIEDKQIEIGALVQKKMDEKRKKIALEIEDYLKNFYKDFKVNELLDDRTIASMAFLIDKELLEDFYENIELLDTHFASTLNFRCVGPLPTYSFYTLEVKKMMFEEIDMARKTLCLGEITTKDQLAKAYREKAASSHPDKNPDKPGIEKVFDKIVAARATIVDYCKACEQAGQSNNYIFNKEEFRKNSILVKLKG